MIRWRFDMPRGWLFTKRYYYRDWRIPRFLFDYLGLGRCASFHMSHREIVWNRLRAKVQVRS